MTSTEAPALTPKQKRVLELLEEGQSAPQIAKKLKISNSGVYGHMRNMRALGIKLPSERLDSNGDGPASEPEAVKVSSDFDIPAAIRSQISVANEAIAQVDAEAERMAARIEYLKSTRVAQEDLIKRHEKALAAYSTD